MKILVTGAAGFIGSHLCEKLVSLNHEVVGLDNFNDYYYPGLKEMNSKDIEGKGIKVHRLDLVSDNLTSVIDDIEIVYHMAAQPGISSKVPFSQYVRNNITATYNLLEGVMNSSSIKLFVNASTSSVYGFHATDSEDTPPKPTSYYGVTKLAAEQLVLAYQRDKDLPSCSFRLFNVIGPRERPEKVYPKIIKSMYDNSFEFPYYQGSESHIRSYTYVGDIVDGLILSMKNIDKCEGEIFNLGTDSAITTQEGLDILIDIVGKKPNIKRVKKIAGDQKETRANIEKARKTLGYNPSTTQREALEEFYEWYKEKIVGKKDFDRDLF